MTVTLIRLEIPINMLRLLYRIFIQNIASEIYPEVSSVLCLMGGKYNDPLTIVLRAFCVILVPREGRVNTGTVSELIPGFSASYSSWIIHKYW